MSDIAGFDVPGCQILEAIGRSDHSVVYRATQESRSRTVAVKRLTSNRLSPVDALRFAQWGRALVAMGAHPNLVEVFDAGVTAVGEPFLVLAYYPRGSIADRVLGLGPVPATEVVSIGTAMADALAFAHEHGVFHGNVKPDNILVGDGSHVALADFCLPATDEGAEPAIRDTLIAADVEGLANTLRALLIGQPSGAADEAGSIVPIGSWPLEQCLARATDPDPERRFASAHQFRDALAATSPDPTGAGRRSEPRFPVFEFAAPTTNTPVATVDVPRDEMVPMQPWPDSGEDTIRRPSLVDPSGAPTVVGSTEPIDRAATSTSSAERPKSRRRRGVVVGAPVAVVLLAVAAVGAFHLAAPQTQSSSPTTVDYAFSPTVLPDGLAVTRLWQLSGEGGNQINEDLTLVNTTQAPMDVPYDEVIPEDIAHSASAVQFTPAPASIVKADPVVRYQVKLAPGQQMTVSYRATVPADGLDRARLDAYAQAYAQAATDYSASVGGAPATSTLTSLSATPSTVTLAVGSTAQVALTGTMSDGKPAPPALLGDVAWSTDDPSVATVTSDGTATARSAGHTTLTVQAGNTSAKVAVEVSAAAPLAAGTTKSASPTTSGATPTHVSTSAPAHTSGPPTPPATHSPTPSPTPTPTYGPVTASIQTNVTGSKVAFSVTVDANGKSVTVHVQSNGTNTTFATGAGAQTWNYSDNIGYSATDNITVTVTGAGRVTVTRTATATTGVAPPTVSVVKGAHCGPGTGLNCQTPDVCNNNHCYRITVITANFTSNVTCTLNSSIGSGGINTPFTMGGNATKATTYWFGAPGGWVSATCNGVTGQSAPW